MAGRQKPVDIIVVMGTKDLATVKRNAKRAGYRVTIRRSGKVGRFNEYVVKVWTKK